MCGNNTVVSVFFEPFETSLLTILNQRRDKGMGPISEQEGVEIINGTVKVRDFYPRHC